MGYGRTVVQCRHYCLPFGSKDSDEAVISWYEPSDFTFAGESRYGRDSRVELECYTLFDGKNAVGRSTAGMHGDWCLQTSKGKMINFNQNGQSGFDEISTSAALIGDWLYLYNANHIKGYWAKFHLKNTVPMEQKIEISE